LSQASKAALGPFLVEDGEPGRVAVAALHDPVVVEDALVDVPEAHRRPPRGHVRRVALPLHAAVAEVVEGVAQHQVDGLGGHRGALHRGAEPEVADLDAGVAGESADADGSAGTDVDDGEENALIVTGHVLDPGMNKIFRLQIFIEKKPYRNVTKPKRNVTVSNVSCRHCITTTAN